jgi:Ca2+-binding RTX toxin-like protein
LSFTQVSVNAVGVAGNADSGEFAQSGNYPHLDLSSTGRFVVFETSATNLTTTADANGFIDIVLKDLLTGQTWLVSAAGTGAIGNKGGAIPTVSDDGRYVVFESYSTFPELGSYVSAGSVAVVYRKDLQTGALEVVTAKAAGGTARGWGGDISADGRYVSFETYAYELLNTASGDKQVFVRDMNGSDMRVASSTAAGVVGNSHSEESSMTENGRYVTFLSWATNLVASDANGKADIFVKDLQTGEIRLASSSASGVQANGNSYDPTVSEDGRYVVFESYATNLIDGQTQGGYKQIYRKDLVTGDIQLVSKTADGVVNNHNSFRPDMSGDGRYVIFRDGVGSNLSADNMQLYLKDTQTGTLTAIHPTYPGYGGVPYATQIGTSYAISTDGLHVAMVSPNALTGDKLGDGIDDVFLLTLTGSTSGSGGTGGSGATLPGGNGNDTYEVDSAQDTISEAAKGGTDTVNASIDFTLPDNVEHLTLTGSANLAGTGNALANRLTGNSGNNTLNGGAGADQMIGGAGDDTYEVDNLGDKVVEAANGGNDTIRAKLAGFSLNSAALAQVEDLAYAGAGNFVGTGNASANKLTGGAGNDTLAGLGGADTLDGGAGNDKLVGGDGDDRFVAEAGNDRYDGGAGTDTLYLDGAAGDYAFSIPAANLVTISGKGRTITVAGVEKIIFADAPSAERLLNIAGTRDLLATAGSQAAESLTGGAAADSLNGLGGNDTLDGGAGNDTLAGGAGNDLYLVSSLGDSVVENAGEGIDTVRISGLNSYTLGANVENLVAAETGDLVVLTGNALNNLLQGSNGNDRLDGGLGQDVLNGGAGDDIYLVDRQFVPACSTAPACGDKIVDSTGTDTIETALARLTLAPYGTIENLTYTGAAKFTGIGNALANAITAQGGADILDGGIGNDTLIGGAGMDVLIGGAGDDRLEGGADGDNLNGGAGNDVFVFATTAAGSPDLIVAFEQGKDHIALDLDIFTGVTDLAQAGLLAESQAAMTADSRLAYEYNASTKIGILYYDADGSGSAASAVAIAMIKGLSSITADDFMAA